MSKEMDALAASIAADTTVQQSVIHLLGDLSKRLTAVIDSGDVQMAVKLKNDVDANTAAMAAAVLANTPAAATEPVPPAP